MIVIALNIYRFSSILVPPSFSSLLLEGIPACFFQDKVKLRGLCPKGQGFRTHFMLVFNIVIMAYVLVPKFKTGAGR